MSAKNNKSNSGLMSVLTMAGAALAGAAVGAVATIMSDDKKRQSFLKTAQSIAKPTVKAVKKSKKR